MATAPQLLADNGADLHACLAGNEEFTHLAGTIIGATEETTTGAFRLRAEINSFKFPTVVINDTRAKRIIENRYGVGQSVVDGIMRATDVVIAGKVAVVCGYGDVGKGSAQSLLV